MWLLYLALEPYVRKFWPTTLISWSRCVAGNALDPQVGRDVLIGVFVAAITLLVGRLDVLFARCSAIRCVQTVVPNLDTLLGHARHAAGPDRRG